MASVKKVFKVLIFGLILAILSLGYRIFGKKQNELGGGVILDIDQASAHAPGQGEGSGSTAGSDS